MAPTIEMVAKETIVEFTHYGVLIQPTFNR